MNTDLLYRVQIHADWFTPVGEGLIPTGTQITLTLTLTQIMLTLTLTQIILTLTLTYPTIPYPPNLNVLKLVIFGN